MHTVSYEFLMKPKESAGCHQTLSSLVGSGHETTLHPTDIIHVVSVPRTSHFSLLFHHHFLVSCCIPLLCIIVNAAKLKKAWKQGFAGIYLIITYHNRQVCLRVLCNYISLGRGWKEEGCLCSCPGSQPYCTVPGCEN